MTSVLGPGKKGFPLAVGFCRQGGVGPHGVRPEGARPDTGVDAGRWRRVGTGG